MGYWDGYGYPAYVSVGERKAKAARKLKKLRKKNPGIQPIILETSTIARTWWGKSWNKNLEKYADYSNRIGRGRSYVRHGSVLDLQIHPGEIRAQVMGSELYSIVIKIDPLGKQTWETIKAECGGKLDSLQELLMGKFPKALEEIFTAKGKGLFPAPKEIRFNCSCPDWASMCKHVAATLYGVGARLDQDPGLFFKLRKVDVNDLISQAVEDKTKKLLKKAEKKSSRVIDDSNLSDIFGIEMDEPVKNTEPKKAKTEKTAKKVAAKAEPVKKTGKKEPAEAEPVKKTREMTISVSFQLGDVIARIKSARNKVKEESAPEESVADTVTGVVRRSRKGVSVADIQKKTGLDERQIRNAVYLAKKQGKIKSARRGVYVKA